MKIGAKEHDSNTIQRVLFGQRLDVSEDLALIPPEIDLFDDGVDQLVDALRVVGSR